MVKGKAWPRKRGPYHATVTPTMADCVSATTRGRWTIITAGSTFGEQTTLTYPAESKPKRRSFSRQSTVARKRDTIEKMTSISAEGSRAARSDEQPVSRRAAIARREFLRWLGGSTLLGPAALIGCRATSRYQALQYDDVGLHAGSARNPGAILDPDSAQNVFQIAAIAKERLGDDAYGYLEGGADDLYTVRANLEAYRKLQIRARRLVDVREIDTTVSLLGETHASPILLAPVGLQMAFHAKGELPTARAAAARNRRMIVSSVSNYSVGEIAAAGGTPVWFQLYPTPDREITRGLLRRAEQVGCRVVVLTVDTPVFGNREQGGDTLQRLLKETRLGNYEGLRRNEPINDSSMTWDMVGWLKSNCRMQVVLKGIVTREDAELSVRHGADGIIVSNHGGRQEESNRATVDSLPEVVAVVEGRIPVLLDGGIRRGTDIFKALALGANAVCIGRPFCWGLAAWGQQGVERVLDLLHAELVRAMQLCGTPKRSDIVRSLIA